MIISLQTGDFKYYLRKEKFGNQIIWIMEFEPIVRLEALTPDILNRDLDSYVEERVKSFNDSFYLVDNKDLYLEALLTISQLDFNKELEWGLWVKLSAKSFSQMAENLSGEISSITGFLVSPIGLYEETLGLEVNLEFDLKSKVKRPNIKILNNHQDLYSDFINGIDKEKYLKWQSLLHGKELT